MKVYPLGYSAHGAEQRVKELMAQPRMLLVDIRLKAYSWRAEWQQEALEKKYGERYRFAGAYLGNLQYRIPGLIEIADPEKGIAGLIYYLKRGHDLILLCKCPSYDWCHRKHAVILLREKLPGVEVCL